MAEVTSPEIISVIIGIFGTIIGLIYWVVKSREKLVYKDVCESERKRLEDCIEGEIEARKEAFKDLKCDINKRFDRLEKLLEK